MGIEESVKNYNFAKEILKLQGFDKNKLNLMNLLYSLKENISEKSIVIGSNQIIFHNWFKKDVNINSQELFIKYLKKNGVKFGKKNEKALLQPRYEHCLIGQADKSYLLEIIGNQSAYAGRFHFVFHNSKKLKEAKYGIFRN